MWKDSKHLYYNDNYRCLLSFLGIEEYYRRNAFREILEIGLI